MRILQISDFHLRGDGKLSFRVVDTVKCLETAVKHLSALQQKPDMMVITGDLADSGDEHAYHMLFNALSSLKIPTYAIPGNHDRRDRMRSILKGWCPENLETAPYLCYAVEQNGLRFLMMDTMSQGSHSGHIPELCADWLERELQSHADVPTLLFMHHPPFLTAMGAMDEPYENVERLHSILAKAPWVRLCCGHMHRPIFTQWAGIPALSAPSASMQIDLDLSPEGGDTFVMEAPGYLLHHWNGSVWNSHVCQIYGTPSYSGPYRFLDSVNPTEN